MFTKLHINKWTQDMQYKIQGIPLNNSEFDELQNYRRRNIKRVQPRHNSKRRHCFEGPKLVPN